MHVSEEIAKWMLTLFPENGWLYQEVVVREIKLKYGSEFIYLNDNKGEAIDRGILEAFKKITEGKVQWSRGDKAWRLVKEGEEPTSRSY